MDKKILGHPPKYFAKIYLTGFTAWYLITQTILTINQIIIGENLTKTIKPALLITLAITTLSMILYKRQQK